MHHLNEKVHDGDEALKVLNTHYEPYTPEEEKKVLRKIDMRMCLLMCAISERSSSGFLPLPVSRLAASWPRFRRNSNYP